MAHDINILRRVGMAERLKADLECFLEFIRCGSCALDPWIIGHWE